MKWGFIGIAAAALIAALIANFTQKPLPTQQSIYNACMEQYSTSDDQYIIKCDHEAATYCVNNICGK